MIRSDGSWKARFAESLVEFLGEYPRKPTISMDCFDRISVLGIIHLLGLPGCVSGARPRHFTDWLSRYAAPRRWAPSDGAGRPAAAPDRPVVRRAKNRRQR